MGDEVELRVRVTRRSDFPGSGAGVLMVDAGDGSPVAIFERTLNCGKLTPKPIAVGDRVTWGIGIVGYTVAAIGGGVACLAEPFDTHDGRPHGVDTLQLEPLANLRRVA